MATILIKIHSGNILIKFADHFSQFLSINKDVTKVKQNNIYKRDFREFNEESFIHDISIQNWSAKNPIGTNPKIDDFLWRLEGCIDRHAPLNKKQLNKISKAWINKFILKMISHCDRLFRKKKKTPLLTNISNILITSFETALLEKLRNQKGNITKNSLKVI